MGTQHLTLDLRAPRRPLWLELAYGMIHPKRILFHDLGAALRGLGRPLQTSALQPWRQRAAIWRLQFSEERHFLVSPSVTSNLIRGRASFCRISQHLITSSPSEERVLSCVLDLPPTLLPSAAAALFPSYSCCLAAGGLWRGPLRARVIVQVWPQGQQMR